MLSDPSNTSTPKNPIGRFMVAAGAVIELNSSGKILLVRRSDKLDFHPSEWEICYGRIDQFEGIETGLRREVFEELGIKDLKIIKVLRVWHMFRGSIKAENELIGITFYCKTKTPHIRLSEEHMEYQWFSPEEALEMIANEGIKEDINRFISGSKF